MFIQVIQGKCTRHDELRAMADGWREELSGGAVGWLGGTYGFTDDDLTSSAWSASSPVRRRWRTPPGPSRARGPRR